MVEMPPPPPPPSPDAATPGRPTFQSQLHNFSFPILKKWGSQRHLRCLSVNRDGQQIIPAPPPTGGLDPVRAKLMAHLHGAADRMNLLLPPPLVPREPDPDPAAPGTRRRRTTTMRAPNPVQIEQQPSLSLSPPAERTVRLRAVRLRSEDADTKERPSFSIALSRQEIAEDIYAVTGCLPRRRPRKRARPIQKQLDSLFPGSWLSEITVDTYKVPY